MRWRLHGCPVCGGDLHEDVEDTGWVVCFMCARSFYEVELVDVAKDTAGDQTLRPAGNVPIPRRRVRVSPETARRAA